MNPPVTKKSLISIQALMGAGASVRSTYLGLCLLLSPVFLSKVATRDCKMKIQSNTHTHVDYQSCQMLMLVLKLIHNIYNIPMGKSFLRATSQNGAETT